MISLVMGIIVIIRKKGQLGREWEREPLHRISFQIRRKRPRKMIVVVVRIKIRRFILSRDIKKILALVFQVWIKYKLSNLILFRDSCERVTKAE